MWRHLPWICGLLTAPLFLGSVGPGGQAIVGLCVGLSLWLLGDRLHSELPQKRILCWLALGLLILPLVPLPSALVGWLSPQHAALSQNFPIEAGVIPAWTTLSLSPASTVQRVWEIVLAIACYLLARTLAKEKGGALRLAMALGIGCLLQAAADVWCRQQDQRVILGFWEVPWGTGAGTFANRNHFANWLYLSALFGLGGFIRAWQPLTSARPSGEAPPRSRVALYFFALVVAVSIVFGVASGSRAGAVSFVAGAAVWFTLLWQRSLNRKRLLKIVLTSALGLALALAAGDALLHRMSEAKLDFASRYIKTDIWQQTIDLVAKFPLLGIGWGAFQSVFSHYKTSGGDLAILHTENDYLETLVEVGVLGAIVLGVLAWRALRGAGRTVWRHKLAEPEFALGAFAALVAFAVHAMFEFVGQIPANVLLAATLLGFLSGCREEAERPAVPSLLLPMRLLVNRLAAVAILLVALLQGASSYLWHQGTGRIRVELTPAQVQRVQTAQRLWPWEIKRHIVLARAQVGLMRAEPLEQQRARADGIREKLNHALTLDPYHWELRLERAWLDIAYSLNAQRAQREALETVRLNPLQTALPARFAAHYAVVDPPFALELLRGIPLRHVKNPAELYEVAWSLDNDTALLWTLTPDTEEGLLRLGDFALSKNLFALAGTVYERLKGRVAAELLADRFLQARQPAQVLKLWNAANATPQQRLYLARAYLQAQQPLEAIAVLEPIFHRSAWRLKLAKVPPEGDLETARTNWFKQRENSTLAYHLVNVVLSEPANRRDPALLSLVADAFPQNPELRWAVYETRVERFEHREAAEAALRLAESLIR